MQGGSATMKKLFDCLYWLMILPFGLFLYVGVKGGLYILELRYEGSGSMIPLMADLFVGGIAAIGLILIFSYAVAPLGKMAAVVWVAIFCIAFNGYFEVWRSLHAMTETPVWRAGMVTGLSVITSIATWSELRSYRNRKRRQATKRPVAEA